MSSLATSEHDFPLGRRLAAALADSDRWVRMGAVQAIARECPTAGREILPEFWNKVEPGSPEQFALAWAIEQCGVDALPLIAPFLGEPADELAAKMDLDHNDWVYFIRSKRDILPACRAFAGLLRRARAERKYFADHAAEQALRTNRYADAADIVERNLHFAAGYLSDSKFQADSSEVFRPILTALRSDSPEEHGAGISGLVNLALCDPNGWFRQASVKALAFLGIEASRLLFPALLGKPPFIPTVEQAKALSSQPFVTESTHPALTESEYSRIKLAGYFAVDALSEFRDEESLSLVVSTAISTSYSEVSARIQDLIATLPVDSSLPQVFWFAVSSPGPSARGRALQVLNQVVAKDEDYGIHLHHVGNRQIDASLEWVAGLARRSLALPSWATDIATAGSMCWSRHRDSTLAVLQNALQLVPYLEGEKDVNYMDRSVWDKFVGQARRIVSLSDRSFKRPTAAVRYPVIEFPKRCQLHSLIRLALMLNLAGSKTSSALPGITLTFPPGRQDIDLVVVVSAPGFYVKANSQVLSVPLDGPSPRLEFELTARDLGPQLVEVTMYCGAERVGYCCLNTEVTARGGSVEGAEVTVFDNATNDDLLRRGNTRAVLVVDWQKDGSLEYAVLDPASGSPLPAKIGTSPTVIRIEDAATWIERQSAIARDYGGTDYSAEDLKATIDGIAAIGKTLFEQLAPAELAGIAESWPQGSIIAVESNAGWIPWELLTESLARPMWGERFQIIRTPRVPPLTPDLARPAVPAGAVGAGRIAVQRIVSVVGDEIGALMAARKEAPYFGIPPEQVEELRESTLDSLREHVKNADIVHFTCHGRSQPVYHLSLGPGPARRLLPKQVEMLELKPGAVVFANACASDKMELLLREFESFGFNFYARGARPFIGTLGPVPVTHAIALAHRFYEWFIVRGAPAGQALQQAKFEITKELNNPFALFYCLYGPASACRSMG